jgi:hypothetical protein
LPILAATLWISISEFLRNAGTLQIARDRAFQGLRLEVPDAMVNNLT